MSVPAFHEVKDGEGDQGIPEGLVKKDKENTAQTLREKVQAFQIKIGENKVSSLSIFQLDNKL